MLFLTIKYLTIVLLTKIHPFHVSVCEIFYNTQNESLEISMKLFTDDFESTIRQGGRQNFLLTESADDEIFSNYLKQRFALKIGQKEVDWDFIGFELRDDAVLCYMLVKKIKPFNEIQIENRVFTEIFTDQINLTHFEYSDKIKSIKTEAKHPSGTITVLD